MGDVVRLNHARTSALARTRASRSNVTAFTLLFFASSTTSVQRSAGMYPRLRQLETTEDSVPSPRETAMVPPSSLMMLSTDIHPQYLTPREYVKPDGLEGDFLAVLGPTLPMAKTAADIGKRLAAMHSALGITQADVCRTIGMASGRYNQYVTGKRLLTLDVAVRLVAAYGVTLDWLFLGDVSALPVRLHQKLQTAA